MLGVVALARNAAQKAPPLTGIIAGSVGALIAGVFVAGLGTMPGAPSMPLAEEQTVVLKVSSTKRVTIEYVVDEVINKERHGGGEWQKTLRLKPNQGVAVMIIGDAWDNVSPKISCEITADGVSVAKKSGTGHVLCGARP